jgi:hypothetical protein
VNATALNAASLGSEGKGKKNKTAQRDSSGLKSDKDGEEDEVKDDEEQMGSTGGKGEEKGEGGGGGNDGKKVATASGIPDGDKKSKLERSKEKKEKRKKNRGLKRGREDETSIDLEVCIYHIATGINQVICHFREH